MSKLVVTAGEEYVSVSDIVVCVARVLSCMLRVACLMFVFFIEESE